MTQGAHVEITYLTETSEARCVPDADAGVATGSGPASERQKTTQSGLRGPVCVVDDDVWVSDSLSAVLELHGFDVVTFASGDDFLTNEHRRTAKCLIVDQHMPGLSGLELIAELRRDGGPPPAILITGRLDPVISERAANSGVLEVLQKPFAAARLVELVERVVGARR